MRSEIQRWHTVGTVGAQTVAAGCTAAWLGLTQASSSVEWELKKVVLELLGVQVGGLR